MKTFQWSKQFETGLATVDDEHRHLVALINRLGESFLGEDAAGALSLDDVFGQLSDYAKSHFEHEETLMVSASLAPEYILRHQRVHVAFVEQLSVLWDARPSMREPGEVLLGFLVEWLGFHILREDQSMAEQLASVKSGLSPAQALERANARRRDDGGTGALVNALQGLYHTLSVVNGALTEANRQLEERVAERTRSLAEANAALHAAYRKMEDLAHVDGLLGIANRRHFDERFEQEWRRAQREHTELSLLMIDVDHFKLYNDAYGHQAGDECLKTVARCMAVGRRPADLLARYGGEELVIMLPNTPAAGALTVAREVCRAVARAEVAHRTSPVATHVTVSVGVATRRPHEAGTAALLVAAADSALYRAKAQGRDRAIAEGTD